MAFDGRRVTVNSTGTPEVVASAEGDDGISVVVRNKSATAVNVGGPDVTPSTGFELAQDETLSVDLRPGEIIYACTATGSVELYVAEAGVG
jgi:hypothetical protein